MGTAPIVLERDHLGLQASSPDVTAATVRRMAEHIRNAQNDTLLAMTTRQALSAAPRQTPELQLCALWCWVKHRVKFTHDDELIWHLLRERDHFELLIAPSVLLRMPRPEGDCDDFTMLLDAMACYAGFEVRIITIACDRRRPCEYSHVCGAALLPNGIWCPLDASHGKYPGWEVPGYDVQRKTAWDLSASVVSDDVRVAMCR